MRVRGVVQDVQGQRLASRAIARLGQQFDGLGIAFLLGHRGGGGDWNLPPGGGPMGQRISRHLSAGQHIVDDDIAVNSKAQRLADADILQGRIAGLGQVDIVIIRTQQRKAAGLGRVFLFQAGILAGGNLGLVQLAGQIPGQRLIFIIDDQGGDGLDIGIGVVPIHRVAFPDQPLLADPLGQGIGPIADHMAGFGPGIAEFLEVGLQHRKRGRLHGHLWEIRLGGDQSDDQRVVIGGRYAQLIGGHRPLKHRIGIDDTHQRDEPTIGRCGGGIGDAPPSIDEIARHDRITIGPFRFGAQGKCIDQAIVTHRMAKRHTGDQIAVGILIIQAFEQIAHNFSARHILDNAGVDGWEIIQYAVGKGLAGGKRLALGQHDFGGRESAPGHKGGCGPGQKCCLDRHDISP